MATFGIEKKEDDENKPQFSFGTAAAASSSAPLSFGGNTNFSLEKPLEASSLFGGGEKVQKFGESNTKEVKNEEGENEAEAESTQEFTPVVQLDEVEVKTLEEDEEIIFKMRARLYRFAETLLNKGTGKKEWIERGVGEAKLLKHREHSKIRLLMRQEKTMKIIVNHVIDPRIQLQPNAGNDKSWVWGAWDFSEGELVDEVFAIRFANAENATKFKDAFTNAQQVMAKLIAGEDGPPNPQADSAAEALSNLKTSEEQKVEDTEQAA
uniref:RanBD1 domain-containing protein n=1 Tax=Aureoumbra lagunensis TaxID=44058 RepID=A0A7S3NPI9_9STRA|eukprot:CAMPEP_0197286218 /NCGR_PEP_ID=MMETSP0890-20130614/1687_1 /TAXON_ID=44058 ORGANISM="Aureoumbra lagunensis, Strain CCMP1510" /NCGR_SAMPLE_ID=MMETSP0890 /ASSEMBLY_ACC=CAM_ASM_000533 /LENGTH=265 /DNA_ID=CAMNT_0042754429 /DNA_START=19 /DNA_END=816 /DNA_ORIENTATION=+